MASMAILSDNVRKLYTKYFVTAFGSTMISCIYGIVDMAVVGQYQGPSGTAALAVVAPVWNIIYSLGLLMGVGGSVLFSAARGSATKGNSNNENVYFTTALMGSVVLAIASTATIWLFERPILTFFGATTKEILDLAQSYLKPIKFVLPLFLMNQMISVFIRNDNDPALATVGVLAGGLFNVFGDIFFTFTLKMGIFGAGLATAMGSAISFAVLVSHFFKRSNTLRITRPQHPVAQFKEVATTGFSSFFIDVAMGILTVIFNRQIMAYLGADALAVYGPIINISTFVQCCAYSVGQAAQPIVSMNYGASKPQRIKETLRCSLYTVAVFGLLWTTVTMLFPNTFIRIFMAPTDAILKIAPRIIRTYALSFLLLPFNIFSTYYFQSIMKPKAAFIVSVFRGLVISGALLLILPLIDATMIWLAMPITELIMAIYVANAIRRYTKEL